MDDANVSDPSAPLTASLLMQLLNQQTVAFQGSLKATEENVMKHTEEVLTNVREDIGSLKEKLKEKDEEIHELKREIEKEKRHRNLILHAIPESEANGRALKELVTKTLISECKVDISNYIDFIFRIGRKREDKPRPVLLALTSFDQKMNIMWSRKHFKSKIEISDDFPKNVSEERKRLAPMLTTLRDLNFKNVHLRYDKLTVDGTECDEERYLQLIEEEKSKGQSIPDITSAKRRLSKDEEQSASKAAKHNEPPSKTTFIGSNVSKNAAYGRNPIKDALKKQAMQSLNGTSNTTA